MSLVFISDKRLLPPRDTQLGKDVMAFCKYLNTIVIDVITYGIWTHPERSPEGLNLLLRLLAKPKGSNYVICLI